MKTLKDWDGTLHRVHAGLYVMNFQYPPAPENVTIRRDRYGRWLWDVEVAGGPPRGDGVPYRHKREATDAALIYIHYGELAGHPVSALPGTGEP